MRYPVNIEPVDEGVFFVSFPDVPEALTQGGTYEEALAMAVDALATALEFYTDDNRPVPLPSLPKPGQPVIEIKPSED
jgi:antitoxin HicB